MSYSKKHLAYGSYYETEQHRPTEFSAAAPSHASLLPPKPDYEGGIRADWIKGDGDDNWIAGYENTDVLCGFNGDDRVEGGTGDDWVFGGDGDDMVTTVTTSSPAGMVPTSFLAEVA